MLLFLVQEYLITKTVEVGLVTIGQVGVPFREEIKYTMWKTGNPEHWVGGRDTQYGKPEEAKALAQQHSDIMVAKSEDVTVTFPTGELLIGSYFHPMDELPEDDKWAEKYSINGAIGRINTMKWLAENRGIAYGQLGNMSFSAYKVNDDRIILTDAYMDDRDYDDEELKITIPDATYLGKICCCVWRFEIVDKADIKKHNFDLASNNDDNDPLEVKVNPGVWDMKVYYQQRSDKQLIKDFGYPLYAELNRRV
jgi:hypothetical protein